jgi:hypothetical protein
MSIKQFLTMSLVSAMLLVTGADFAQGGGNNNIEVTGTWNITCGHVGPGSTHIMGNGQAIFYKSGKIAIWQRNVSMVDESRGLNRWVTDGYPPGATDPAMAAITRGKYEVDSDGIGVIWGMGGQGQFPPENSEDSPSFIVTQRLGNRATMMNLAITLDPVGEAGGPFLLDNPAYLINRDTPEIP